MVDQHPNLAICFLPSVISLCLLVALIQQTNTLSHSVYSHGNMGQKCSIEVFAHGKLYAY